MRSVCGWTRDGIRFDTQAGADILIGGASTSDSNYIVGGGDGIRFLSLFGNSVTIAGNSRIEGFGTAIGSTGDAIRTGTVNQTLLAIAGNDELIGADDGINVSSTANAAAILIFGNGTISGADNGIEFRPVINGSNISVRNGSLLLGGGIVSYGGNSISGGNNGVIFEDTVSNSNVTLAGNAAITGTMADGISFNTFSDTNLLIGGSSSTSTAPNETIEGQLSGIQISSATGGTIDIVGNTTIKGTDRAAIEFENSISGSDVFIRENTTVTGLHAVRTENIAETTFLIADNVLLESPSSDALQFFGTITDSDVFISDNDEISSFGDAIYIHDEVAGSKVVIGAATVDVGGTEVTYNGNITIDGGSDGLDIDSLYDSELLIIDNSLISGDDNAIEFDDVQTVSSVAIARNATIRENDEAIILMASLEAGRVDISGNTLIESLMADAIVLESSIRDVDLTIGTSTIDLCGIPTFIGGNGSIAGYDDGINTDEILDASVLITGNQSITGTHGSGIEFDSLIHTGASVNVIDNVLISGPEAGIEFDTPVESSRIGIAGNESILATDADAILFAAPLDNVEVLIGSGPWVVSGSLQNLNGNGSIEGRDDGINIDEIENSSFRVIGNQRIEGILGSGIEFDNHVSDGSVLQVINNLHIEGDEEGVEFDTTVDSSLVQIAGNQTIAAGLGALAFFDTVSNSTIQVAGNEQIVADIFVGIGFFDVEDSDVFIGPTTIDVQGTAVSFGPNGLIAAAREGIYLGSIHNGTVTIADNAMINAPGFRGTGLLFDQQISGNTLVNVQRNHIEGAHGIRVPGGIADDVSLSFLGNTIVGARSLGLTVADIDSSVPVIVSGGTIQAGEIGLGFGQFAIGQQGSPDGRVIVRNVSIASRDASGLLAINRTMGTLELGLSGVTVSGMGPQFAGLRFVGPGLSLTNNTLADTQLRGIGGNFVVLEDGALFEPGQPTVIDGSRVNWDGLSPGQVAQRAIIDSRIVDYHDNPTLGLILIGAGGVNDQTYDRFGRYQDFHESTEYLASPNETSVRYPGSAIQIADELGGE